MVARTIPIRTSRSDPTVHHWTLANVLDDLGLTPTMHSESTPWRMTQVYRKIRYELVLYSGVFNVYIHAIPSVPLNALLRNFDEEELPASRIEDSEQPMWHHDQLIGRTKFTLPKAPGPFTIGDTFVSWRYIVEEARAFIDGLLRLKDAGLCTIRNIEG